MSPDSLSYEALVSTLCRRYPQVTHWREIEELSDSLGTHPIALLGLARALHLSCPLLSEPVAATGMFADSVGFGWDVATEFADAVRQLVHARGVALRDRPYPLTAAQIAEIERWARSSDPFALASHIASPETLARLACDDNPTVRLFVAANPETPGWARARLASDSDPTVAYMARNVGAGDAPAQNARITKKRSEVAAKFTADALPGLAAKAAQSAKTVDELRRMGNLLDLNLPALDLVLRSSGVGCPLLREVREQHADWRSRYAPLPRMLGKETRPLPPRPLLLALLRGFWPSANKRLGRVTKMRDATRLLKLLPELGLNDVQALDLADRYGLTDLDGSPSLAALSTALDFDGFRADEVVVAGFPSLLPVVAEDESSETPEDTVVLFDDELVCLPFWLEQLVEGSPRTGQLLRDFYVYWFLIGLEPSKSELAAALARVFVERPAGLPGRIDAHVYSASAMRYLAEALQLLYP